MLGCFRLFIYAAVVMAAALGVIAFFALRPEVDTSDLSEVVVSDRDRTELNIRLAGINAKIDQSKKTGVSVPVHISISETELASKIDAWSGEKLFTEFRDLRAHFKEDTLVIVGTMRIGRFDFPFRNDISFRIDTGARSLELVRMQIGGLFLPGPLRAGLVGLAERSVDAGFPRPPIEVETLLFSEDTLVISGSTRG